jgi:hypothetical protein
MKIVGHQHINPGTSTTFAILKWLLIISDNIPQLEYEKGREALSNIFCRPLQQPTLNQLSIT